MDVSKLVKDEVLKIDPGAKVVLFGSRARGDYSDDSDWDFLILLSQNATEKIKRTIRDKIFDVELKSDEIISSLIEQQEEWEKFWVTPLFKNIEREGKAI